jgi:hypothetical protein
VTEIAAGPAPAHGEGHVVVVADRPATAGSSLPEASDLGAAARTQALVTRLAIAALALVVLAVAVWLALRWRRRRG